MSFAFKPSGGQWIEIEECGTLLPGGGENGEDVVVSHAFVASLPLPVRAVRGLAAVSEPPRPPEAIGWTIGEVDGLPVRVWTLPEE